MGVYIKHWSLADWKELLKWAKIGANNAMIGEFTEVEELPPHGRLIDADAMSMKMLDIGISSAEINRYPKYSVGNVRGIIKKMPTIIEEEK